MKIRKKYIFLAVILVVGGGYYWYSKSNSSTGEIQYVTAPAEKGTLTTSISGSGNVIVDQQSTVDPTITGTVANVSIKVGDSVKKGQFLFNIINDQLGIDVSNSSSSLLQAKQALESAKASKKQAKYDLDRNSEGATQRKILENKYEAAKISQEADEQNVEVAEARYQNSLSDANKRKVVAPIDGTVNAINIKNGDDLSRISSGNNSLAPIIIGDLLTLKTQIAVNEVDISNVSIGQKVTMTFNGIEGLTTTGKVEKMDSLGTIAQGVVTYNSTISFDTLDPRIKSGMSVSASIITGVKQDVIIVPNSAVKAQSNNNYVEVLNDGGVPQQVAVQVGVANNTDTEIVSGINVGDKVVTRTVDPSAAATTTTSTQGQGGGGGGGGLRIPGVGGGFSR